MVIYLSSRCSFSYTNIQNVKVYKISNGWWIYWICYFIHKNRYARTSIKIQLFNHMIFMIFINLFYFIIRDGHFYYLIFYEFYYIYMFVCILLKKIGLFSGELSIFQYSFLYNTSIWMGIWHSLHSISKYFLILIKWKN